MKIMKTILYFFLAAGVICSNLRQKTQSNQSIKKILRSIVYQDVIIRIQGRNTYDVMENLLEIVTETVTSRWPLQIFLLDETDSDFIQLRDMASSRTLLIYLYESDNDASYTDLTDTLTDISLISYPKHMPKLLLMVGSTGHTLNALYQLRHLWDLGFFDVVIIEMSSRAKHVGDLFVAVHRFNGFNDDYVKLTMYQDNVDWYPDKARNLYGNPLKVTFVETRSYGSLDPASGEVNGLAKEFSDALGIVLNATVFYAPLGTESNMVYDAQGLVYTDWYSTRYEHTVAVGDDRICLLMPLSPAEVLLDFWPILVTIVIGLLLVAIVWCTSVVLRISKRMRDPLNTISMILGITPLYEPRSLVEKILFVALMMTAAEYTFTFQTTLFEFVIEFARHKQVSTFEDLYETGLKVLVSPMVYNELAVSEDVSPKFLKRFKLTYTLEEELITSAKTSKTSKASKGFFMSEIDGKLAEIMLVNRKGDRLYKLSELCIMSHKRVHSLPIRSPYRSEINRVLLSLMEYGFAKKQMDDFWMREGEKNIENRNELILSDHSIYVAFIVLCVGYGISIVAFVAEFTAARILERRQLFRIKYLQIIARRLRR